MNDSLDTMAKKLEVAIKLAVSKEAMRQNINLSAADECEIKITNQSHLHRQHKGAGREDSHYKVIVISKVFRRMTPLSRHRLVMSSATSLFASSLHALTIETKTQ